MIYEIIGWTGTSLILLAYFLLSTHKISSDSKNYQLMNLLGGLGILINALIHGAIPSVGLNVVWSLIAIYGLMKAVKK